MIRFHSIAFFILSFWATYCYSQHVDHIAIDQNATLQELLHTFENQHQFDFAYDVEVINNIKLKIDQDSIGIDSLITLLKEQTQFTLQKVADRSYILIENEETIEICGFLIDSVTTFELIQANILNNNENITLTDERGHFSLRAKPWDLITISYLGYHTATIKATNFSGVKCDAIRLNPEVQNLSQVVIKEYLTTGIQKKSRCSY